MAPAPLPAHVRAEANRGVVALPPATANLNSREAMALIAAIRKSEVRKDRAIRQAVRFDDRRRSSYRKVKRKKGSPSV